MKNHLLTVKLFIYGFAISFFIHGAVRFPKLTEFAEGMSQQFEASILSGWPSLYFAYCIPVLECLTAVLIMLPKKRLAFKGAQLGVITMSVIMIGTCLIEKWNLLSSQLIHSLIFVFISFFIVHDELNRNQKLTKT